MRTTALLALLLWTTGSAVADPIPPASRDRAERMTRWRGILDEAGRAVSEARYDEAEAFYRSLLDEAGEERGMLPARAIDGLADLYHAQERYEPAAELYRRSIAQWEQLLGPRQPRLATSLQNLAVVYLELDRAADAAPLAERAARIFETALGPDSPQARQAREVARVGAARR